jgi:phytoene synthase
MEGSIAVGPPTRDHDSENFPVASLVLPRAVRPKVLAFYRFVRTADDIADSPALTEAEKLRRLDALELTADDALKDVGTGEARAMLSAFRQDATQTRYTDWAALEAYCARSADPVGRMLLRLHGEDAAANRASDALCTALQILNHLQDLVTDREALDRLYLPVPWMDLAGGEDAFFTARNDKRRAVLDAALDRVEAKLEVAAALPRLLRSRLRLQAIVTLRLAWRLLAKLREADPVTGRGALTRWDFAHAFVSLAQPSPSDAAVVRARVARAGSSFTRGMLVLKGDRRRALFAVYGFCRAVDDIADATMPEAEKRRFLAEWRDKLIAPDCALSRELAWAREAFALPLDDCEAMIEGMETDAADRVRLARGADLDTYCYRVAGTVGRMSVRIFGVPEAVGFGARLGHTLQLVNILRDLDEDAQRDRVYIPLNYLGRQNIADGAAPTIVSQPGIAVLCGILARRVERGFAGAERDLMNLDARAMRPAAVMMWAYRRLFERMRVRGWQPGARQRPRLTRAEKLRMAFFALAPP